MKVKLFFGLIFISFLVNHNSFAQIKDTVDTETTKSVVKLQPLEKDRTELQKMPQRALLRSMIIPGWGQATNRRWWKIPIIYGGLYIFVKEYIANRDKYREYLSEAQYRIENPTEEYGNPAFAGAPTEGIIKIKDLYSRNRDICAFAVVGMYVANIVDAYVDAKFFQFDISDKLSLKVRPSFQMSPQSDTFASMNPTLKISLSL